MGFVSLKPQWIFIRSFMNNIDSSYWLETDNLNVSLGKKCWQTVDIMQLREMKDVFRIVFWSKKVPHKLVNTVDSCNQLYPCHCVCVLMWTQGRKAISLYCSPWGSGVVAWARVTLVIHETHVIANPPILLATHPSKNVSIIGLFFPLSMTHCVEGCDLYPIKSAGVRTMLFILSPLITWSYWPETKILGRWQHVSVSWASHVFNF